jgi:transposase-like protein
MNLREHYVETIYQHIKGGDLTLTEASHQLGWSRQTVERVAKARGVTMKPAIRGNTSGLSAEIREEILAALKAGSSRMAVCSKYSVKRTTLDNWVKKWRIVIPTETAGRKPGTQYTVERPQVRYVSAETPEFQAAQLAYYRAKVNARWFGGHGE